MQEKIFLNRAFSIASKGNNYFPGNKLFICTKCTKPNQNCFVCIADGQGLKIIPHICLIFSFKVFRLPPLHLQISYSKCLFFFGYNYFISKPIFKLCGTFCRTHELQKASMILFFLWCLRKVRVRKMQFLIDCVQTVGCRILPRDTYRHKRRLHVPSLANSIHFQPNLGRDNPPDLFRCPCN